MKRVVVTGALGFIGFSLTRRLLEKGFEVVGIDGMIAENQQGLYEEKLLWIGRNSLFKFIDQKIEDLDLKAIFDNVDAVFHLAFETKRDGNWEELRTTIENNLKVTAKIISACDKNNKLIYTSSTQVYGETAVRITEMSPQNSKAPDSLTKIATESLIKSRCTERRVPYVILRLPTIYGPWQRKDMTYSQLIINHLKLLKVDVAIDRVTEDVLYIDDILDTLVKVGLKKDCQNEEYNLSTGKISEWYRGKAIITNEPFADQKDKRSQMVISNEKVTNDLDFKVHTDLKTGIEAQKLHIKQYQQLYLK